LEVSREYLRLLRLVVFAGAMGDKSDVIGYEDVTIDDALAALKEAGLIEHDGFIAPTPLGVQAVDDWYARDRQGLSEADKRALIAQFRPLDLEIKRLASAWQDATARDDWDGRLASIEALTSLHAKAMTFVDHFAAAVPRFAEFQRRLEHAISLVLDGETDFFVGVRCDSYHTVWFHFHEDLLRLVQRDRDRE
jgi:pyruvate,orthophosphate dikinase